MKKILVVVSVFAALALAGCSNINDTQQRALSTAAGTPSIDGHPVWYGGR
ncbi:MAG: hypothetical protein HQ450_09885 [Alcaligenaceae bacterium]|nr:hypothetical protein [Alcaligenaceae bacterium]